jgi:putative ABC transport system permease protein
LRLNKKRSVITVIAIALSVAMVTAISGFIVSFQDLLYQDSVAREGLWHVRYFGLSEEIMARVGADPAFSSYERLEGEEGPEIRLLFAEIDRHIFERSEEICLKYGIDISQAQYNNNLLIALGIIPAGYYEPLYSFAAILLSLVAIASIMVIRNAFSISAAERSRQFGLLKSVGATGSQIRGAVLSEGFILAAFSIPVGILLGLLVQWVALSIANSIISTMNAIDFMASFRVRTSLPALLLAVGSALVTIFLAAFMPALRASKISAIEAIRQTGSIKMRSSDVRVLPLTGRLFGFEGILAAKTMKRSRGRYRTTVISLVVSVVLFVGVSSFGQMLMKASSMVYENYGSNLLVNIYGEDKALQDELAAELSAPGATFYPHRTLNASVLLDEDYMTPAGLEMFGGEVNSAVITSLPDGDFNSLCESLGLDSEDFIGGESPGAILINTSGTFIVRGRRHSFTPYSISAGQTLSINPGSSIHSYETTNGSHQIIYNDNASLTILAETDEIPVAVGIEFISNALNLIVPEATRAALMPENQSDVLRLAVMTSDANAFEARAKEHLASRLGENEFYIFNYEAMAENNRNIWLLVMIFVYGFIALLSLISVTNLVTTISTGIALRQREFAMLRSLGMTKRGINRTLSYESLICGFKAIALGVPLGIAVSFAMYHALDGAMSFEYIWPTQSVIISIAAVLALTLLTMRLASSRLRKGNISSAMQSEII